MKGQGPQRQGNEREREQERELCVSMGRTQILQSNWLSSHPISITYGCDFEEVISPGFNKMGMVIMPTWKTYIRIK